MDLSSLSAEIVLGLPPDELALRILATLTAGEGEDGFFFGRDRLTMDRHTYAVESLGNGAREYERCLAEAWAWLEREVLVANEPTQSSPNWYFARAGAGLSLRTRPAWRGLRRTPA